MNSFINKKADNNEGANGFAESADGGLTMFSWLVKPLLLAGFLLLAASSVSLRAEENSVQQDTGEGAEQSAEAPSPEEDFEPPELSEEVRVAALVHQACVNQIMSTQENAEVKRQRIKGECAELEGELIQQFPEEMREFITTDVHRQIESVLVALELMEERVIETAEDAEEIANELAQLEADERAAAIAEAEEAFAAEEARAAESAQLDAIPLDLPES
jgi:hypothetical protein